VGGDTLLLIHRREFVEWRYCALVLQAVAEYCWKAWDATEGCWCCVGQGAQVLL